MRRVQPCCIITISTIFPVKILKIVGLILNDFLLIYFDSKYSGSLVQFPLLLTLSLKRTTGPGIQLQALTKHMSNCAQECIYILFRVYGL